MHLNRLNAPKTWKLKEIKSKKWITKSIPGPHSVKTSLPINILLKEVLNYANTTRETKNIVTNKKVLVNKKVVKTINYPVGMFDVIEFPEINECYRLILDKDRRFNVKKIKKEESNLRPCKVIGKKLQKKGKIQLGFDNGMSLITDDKTIKVGDTVVIELEKIKIVKHLKFSEGVLVMITEGKHIGNTGTIKEIKSGVMGRKSVKVNVDGVLIETSGDYAFVLDDELSY